MRKFFALLMIVVVSLLSVNTVVFAQFDDQAYEDQVFNSEWDAGGSNERCDPKKDIMLNTHIPFVWRCIKKTVETDAWSKSTLTTVFPKLVWWVSRIVMTAIIILWFLWILVWWFMIAADGAFGTKAAWVKLIVSVVAWLILLWASWVILNLINPSFFGLDS